MTRRAFREGRPPPWVQFPLTLKPGKEYRYVFGRLWAERVNKICQTFEQELKILIAFLKLSIWM